MESTKGLLIDAELDVNISVLPYTGCYISRIRDYDECQDFISIYELNDLSIDDQRLIRVKMFNDECNNIGEIGIKLKLRDSGHHKLIVGDKCNYIPYQLIKNCQDGDSFDYMIQLPYKIIILLHVTCQQQSCTDEYNFDNMETAKLFTKFDTAVNRCKNERLII